ncbi:MAG: quinolinate synthase [Nitrospirae bacterium]|nr:MAG: quinolinate synthase [Nitrospirota bacterium]
MSDIVDRISRLKEERNAIILAHNYQRPEVQDIADYTGDSLELSRIASKIDCDVIVFCGVNFMAESASILSPDKTVLLPAEGAFCPMADMITVSGKRKMRTLFPGYDAGSPFIFPEEFTLLNIKEQYPGAPVVTYVNSTADVKAASDVCCTSANGVDIVRSLDEKKVICVPDRHLAAWIAYNNKDKEIISWDGFCHVHDRVSVEDVERARKKYPKALLMAHPECRLEVLLKADHVASTSGMLRIAAESDAKEFIVGTEVELLHPLRKNNPDKIFYPLREDMICPNMKKTTLKSILKSLEDMEPIVKVPEEIRVNAKKALDRMLSLSISR